MSVYAVPNKAAQRSNGYRLAYRYNGVCGRLSCRQAGGVYIKADVCDNACKRFGIYVYKGKGASDFREAYVWLLEQDVDNAGNFGCFHDYIQQE